MSRAAHSRNLRHTVSGRFQEIIQGGTGMINVLSYILFAFCLITLFFGLSVILRSSRHECENKLFFLLTLCSSFWSFCWSMLLAQTEAQPAYIWRSVGMASVFGYMVLATTLLLRLANMRGAFAAWIFGFSFVGFILLPFNINRSYISFKHVWFGMSYQFEPNFWFFAYNIYTAIVFINIAIIVIYMFHKHTRTYQKVLARKIVLSELGLFFGVLLDTFCPMFGLGAFPGSSLGQALCVMMLFPVMLFTNRSHINISNLAQYIYTASEAPILIIDNCGVPRIANDSAYTFFDLDYDRLAHMHILDIFDIKPTLLPTDTDTSKLECSCLLNKSFCSLRFSRISDMYGDLLGFIIVITDLTDKQMMIRQLETERNRANRANEAKSSFLAKMSHEIRTPINAILGMDEMILRESPTESISKYALDIKSAGKSLLAIINDILDFSKIESGKMELIEDTYSLGTMIHDLVNVLSVKAENKGLSMNIVLAPDTPSKLYGDEVRIRQIITNILNNAIKYTEKGSVTLDVNWEKDGTDSITLIIMVADTGIGIRKEDIGSLFQAFQRADLHKTHTIEGTGLGLSIVQRFVELMHGTIDVTSEYGKGSCFTVRLPQKVKVFAPVGKFSDFESAQETPIQTAIQRTAPDARVLIVDDNRVNIAVLKGLLKRTKVQADSVQSGAACLEKVKTNTYHIIYLDHMMPEMDGIETLKHLKEMPDNASRDAIVIALTANAIVGAKEEYLALGFHDYLSKPIESEQLEEMLFSYLPAELIQ